MNAHEVLVKARNLIEREGWGQGRGCTGPRDSHCVVTALKGAGSQCPQAGRERGSPHAELALVIGDGCTASALFRWNDTPGRTKEEVLAAFDEAIRRTAPPPVDPLPRESYEDYCERQQRKWDEAVR